MQKPPRSIGLGVTIIYMVAHITTGKMLHLSAVLPQDFQHVGPEAVDALHVIFFVALGCRKCCVRASVGVEVFMGPIFLLVTSGPS